MDTSHGRCEEGSIMCGRYRIDRNDDEMKTLLRGVGEVGPEIFPTQPAPVVAAHGKSPRLMLWGFPRRDEQGVLFNAPAETAAEQQLFREALYERRAAVPTSGFFEWKDTGGSKKKDKYIFHDRPYGVLYLAGVYGTFYEKEYFAILTTVANDSVALYHSRMPVTLDADEVDEWLFGKGICGVFGACPEDGGGDAGVQ